MTKARSGTTKAGWKAVMRNHACRSPEQKTVARQSPEDQEAAQSYTQQLSSSSAQKVDQKGRSGG
jgi:hypothetical protein